MTDLYLPPNQPDQTWTETFNTVQVNSTGTIHWSGWSNAVYPTPTNSGTWSDWGFGDWEWTNS
jgi:hypothetical protein